MKANNEFSSHIQSLEDIIISLTKEKKSLEVLITKFANSIPNTNTATLIGKLLIVNEQVFQIQRDRIKLIQRLRELDCERKFNESDNKVVIEYNNIRHLLDEYETRYNSKLEELINLDNELNKHELFIKKHLQEYQHSNSSSYLRKFETTNDSDLKSNYLEKHPKSDYSKFDRKTKTNEIVNKQSFPENHNFKGYERPEQFPTKEDKFQRVKCKVFDSNYQN